MVVQAPEVSVAAPEVNVTTDTKPLVSAINELKTDRPDVVNGAVQTQDITGLVTEKYTSFIITYMEDSFDEESDEKRPGKITYYDGKKVVATLTFSYKGEDLIGVKRV